MDAKSFEFNAPSAKSLGNNLSNVKVSLPNFFVDKHHLLITGLIDGDSKDKIHYLHASPLEDMFAKTMAPLNITGPSKINLALDIPLADPEQTKVKGDLKLDDNHLDSAEWKLDFTDVNGQFKFTENHFDARLITAKTLGSAINASIKTVLENENNRMNLQAVGVFSDQQIRQELEVYGLNPAYTSFLKGQSELKANLTIPFSSSASPLKKIQLNFSSNLKGMKINLPEPLGKQKNKIRNFSFVMDMTGDTRNLALNYDDYHVLLQAVAGKSTFEIIRGSVGFNKKVVLPKEQGYRLSGRLPKFYWSEWKPVLFPNNEKNSLFSKGGDSSLLFNVNVANMELFGQHFENVVLHASKTALNWFVHVNSPKVEGDITLPPNLYKMPISADLTKLQLNVKDKSSKDKGKKSKHAIVNPEDFPLLDIKIGNLIYNKMHLGKVSLQTEKMIDGQKIKSMSMDPRGSKLKIEGSWFTKAGKQKTQIKIQVDAQKFGNTLNAWDFNHLIGDGKGTLNLDIFWPGNPVDFSFKTIEGKFDFKLKEASLLDYDLGAAKLFTVLIPRRLILDFKDVPKAGMYFDTMSGEYTIQSGKAFTNGVKLRGPVADIDLAGNIGLASKTFDQVVTVNRRLIGDTLPIVGSVIPGAGPIIGGGLFVFKKLFEKQIDDIFTVQYTVKGSWAKPVIKEVKKLPANSGGDGADGVLSE